MNGEMIGKADPCELCRCFYGRELCQIQRCPTPPPDCVPDKVPGFCCPRFTCGNFLLIHFATIVTIRFSKTLV